MLLLLNQKRKWNKGLGNVSEVCSSYSTGMGQFVTFVFQQVVAADEAISHLIATSLYSDLTEVDLTLHQSFASFPPELS